VFSLQSAKDYGWLTGLTVSEGSDNEMWGSEEDAGQKRSRCKFVVTVVITVNIQIK
jgi:hypothetical protein